LGFSVAEKATPGTTTLAGATMAQSFPEAAALPERPEPPNPLVMPDGRRGT
jgi:hypothetical protein